jgi:hypothetical protein
MGGLFLLNRFTLEDPDCDLIDVETLEEVPEIPESEQPLHRSDQCPAKTATAYISK